MNTSKEAEKKTAKQKETNFDNIEPLTKDEQKQMENLPAKTEKKESTIDVDFQKLSDGDFIDQVFDSMEAKKSNEAIEATSNYIDFDSFKKGEERNYLFIGTGTFTTKDGEVKPAVKLMDRERNTYLCASTVVVSSLNKIEKIPCGVRIQVNGKVKGARGEYYDCRVFIL